MNSIEFLKNKSAKIPVNLDFSKEEDCDFLMDMLGGEAFCMKNCPAFYQIYRNTKELHAETNGRHYKTLLQEEDAGQMMDDLFITCLFYDKERQRYSFEARSSFTEETDFLMQQILVCDGGNNILFKDYTIYPDIERAKEKKSCMGDSIKAEFAVPKDDKSISAYFTVLWKKDEELRAQVYGKSFSVDEIVGGAGIKNFQMENPVKKSGTGPIVVVYNRKKQSKEAAIDYEYPQNIQPDGQELYLEVSGYADMVDGAVISDVLYQDIILRVTCGGTADYKKIEERNVVNIFPLLKEEAGQRAGKRFPFSFDLDWGAYIPGKRLPVKDPVDFFMEIPYVLTNGMTGHLIASSVAYEERGPHIKEMPQLLLLWGCLEENSRIRMADGSWRAIRDIRIGDRVKGMETGEGKTSEEFCVKEIVAGREDVLYTIETEDGKKVTCSESHVFLTSEGMKQVKHLCGRDVLIGEDGQPLRITALYPGEGGNVCNLLLETSENACRAGVWMAAEGLWSGDFMAQNNASRPRRRAASAGRFLLEAQAMQKELEAWKNIK